MQHQRRRHRRHALVVLVLLTLSAGPALFNYVIDPFAMNRSIDLGFDKEEISLKAHYPLWKMIDYPRTGGNIFVLGDSRARALQDKYWSEIGVKGVYNFAYGGATIPEIHETFVHLRQKTKPKALIIGIPLRSVADDHRGGLNRVPEAITLSQNPLKYYTSWFVARIGWRNLDYHYGEQIKSVTARLPLFIAPANAASAGEEGTQSLIEETECSACALPQPSLAATLSRPTHIGSLGMIPHLWRDLWARERLVRDLPDSFERQVVKNARNDWRRFVFSEALFTKIETIAAWCAAHDVPIVFVIPATIAEMQNRIADFGIAAQNHAFRERLARLAPVIDFDYDNAFTRDLSYFKDAYHFDSRAAREMVREIGRVLDLLPTPPNKEGKTKRMIQCVPEKAATPMISDQTLTLHQGKNCRLWRKSDA